MIPERQGQYGTEKVLQSPLTCLSARDAFFSSVDYGTTLNYSSDNGLSLDISTEAELVKILISLSGHDWGSEFW